MFKFDNSHMNTSDIFKPGYLDNLYEKVLNGEELKKTEKLDISALSQIVTIYAGINPRKQRILELDDNDKIKTYNDKIVLGKDVKSITLLMWLKSRSAYVDFGRITQVHQASLSGAVPIPLLGFKRYWNIPYNSWRTKALQCKTVEEMFNLDILLGRSLSSTGLDNGTVYEEGLYGLIQASKNIEEMFDADTVLEFRKASYGKRAGNMLAGYGANHIPGAPEGYNESNTFIRMMLMQRWTYFSNHRCDEMICDVTNWDNMPEPVEGNNVVNFKTLVGGK
jgi:hypothetical protein